MHTCILMVFIVEYPLISRHVYMNFHLYFVVQKSLLKFFWAFYIHPVCTEKPSVSAPLWWIFVLASQEIQQKAPTDSRICDWQHWVKRKYRSWPWKWNIAYFLFRGTVFLAEAAVTLFLWCQFLYTNVKLCKGWSNQFGNYEKHIYLYVLIKKLQMFVCFVENWLLLMAVNVLAVQMSGCHAGLIMFALHINVKDCIQKDSVFMTVQSQ